MSRFETRRGLTLIEILIAITLIVLLTGVYFMVANPGGQLNDATIPHRILLIFPPNDVPVAQRTIESESAGS